MANGKLLCHYNDGEQRATGTETMTAYGHKNHNHKQKYLPNRQMNEVSFIGFIVRSPERRTENGDDGEYNEAIWMMHATPQFNLFLLTIFVHRNEIISIFR